MKKVIAVSVFAMAGMFSAQALADESKTGFYMTGKAGDFRFISFQTSVLVDGEGEWADQI